MLLTNRKLQSKLVIQILVVLLLAFVSINAQSKHSKQRTQSSKEKSQKTLSKQEKRKALLEARKKQLEEIRRRQEAIRRERERRLAFERGLHQETVENILNDNPEGEDLEIRRAAINALGNHAGTVVVMETQTGRILTIVNQNWAIRKSFKPCSTIKLVTAAAGINEGIINQNGEIISYTVSLNLTDALAFSNNTYFQKVGLEIGNEKFITYAKILGLGETTGINAEGESSGKLPYGNNSLRVYSHGDDVEVTPLQLAVMVSAIANGGKIVIPQIPKSDVQKIKFAVKREMSLPKQTLQSLLPGMIGAVAYGTARNSDGIFYSVAGKTGSCIGQGSWLGLFASVAPVINPKYTIVVVTRGQGERGKIAAAIAGKIYQKLFNQSKDAQILLAESKNKFSVPKPQVDAKLSMLLDGENEEANEVFGDNIKRPRVKQQKQDINDLLLDEGDSKDSRAQQEPLKNTKVKKTSNVFNPVIIEVKKESTKTEENNKSENKENKEQNQRIIRPRVVKSETNIRIIE
jgi:cell division protein FtsI/penicillin-binding protein 2